MIIEVDQDSLARATAALVAKWHELGMHDNDFDEDIAGQLAVAAISSVLADIVKANQGTIVIEQ